MTLYDISAALEEAFERCIDPETGEILEDTSELDELALARDEKIENIGLYIKNLQSDALAIRAEELNLAKRRKSCENRAAWLRKYLANNLQGESFKTPKLSVSWRKSESVEVENVWDLPDDYVRFQDPVPDKRKIAESLKKGIEVSGAELVTNLNMIIK